MTTEQLQQLLSVAERARSEKSLALIRYDHGGGRLMIEDGNNRQLIADFYDEANREHYAAFDPATCAELVRRLMSAEAEVMRLCASERGEQTLDLLTERCLKPEISDAIEAVGKQL